MVASTRGLCRASSEARIPVSVSMSDVAKEREKAAERYVVLYDLAEYLGVSGVTLTQHAKRNGIRMVKARRPLNGYVADPGARQ